MRLALAALLLIVSASPACAHGLRSEASVADGWVTVRLLFSDDTPAAGATVTAYRLGGSGRVVAAEGKTDPQGAFRFRADPGRYRVVAVEVGGHRIVVEVGVTAAGEAAPVSTASAGSGDHPQPSDLRSTPVAVVLGLLVIALLGGALAFAQRGRREA